MNSHRDVVERLSSLADGLRDLTEWNQKDINESLSRLLEQSEAILPVKFGVPQESVLGPTLFSLFCHDLPDIAGVRECEIHMYADDTTIYVAESSPDKVVVVLSSVLQKLYEWCCRNRLIPHCGKTECMIIMRGQFVGPLQAVSLGKCRHSSQVN